MTVIQEVFQCIIEAMEGYDYTHLFVHDVDGRLFEQSQHGTLTAGQMLARRTVCTDGGQHAGKQIELIRNKGIDLCKVGFVGIQLFLSRVVEDNEVLDDCCFLLIEQPEGLRCRICLFEDSLLDNRIHIGRREGKTGVKAPLNFGEVVALNLGDRVNVLLAGHDDPCLAHTFLTQFFGHGLEVEHEFGILSDVLADLIHKEDNMVVVSLAFNIGFDALCKVFNADGIRLNGLFAPVPSSRFAHEIH